MKETNASQKSKNQKLFPARALRHAIYVMAAVVAFGACAHGSRSQRQADQVGYQKSALTNGRSRAQGTSLQGTRVHGIRPIGVPPARSSRHDQPPKAGRLEGPASIGPAFDRNDL